MCELLTILTTTVSFVSIGMEHFINDASAGRTA